MFSRGHILCLALLFLSLTIAGANGDPLAPDDASILDRLVSWHRDAASNYADGVWSATVGPSLEQYGEAGNGSDFFEAPELATYTPEEGYFDGLTDVNGVLFKADVSDMLVAEELLGGDSFEELTLIGVYQTTGNTDRTRPVGIGSFMEGAGADHFNLSSDASLRYDNGNNQTDPFFHLPDLTYRVGILSDGLVSDYLDGELITDEEFPGGNFSGITRNDSLFLGDLRGGTLDAFTSTDLHDIFVAEVIVYDGRLNDTQVAGIGEWLQANLATGATAANPCDFDRSGVLDLADIDLLREAVRDGSNEARFDLNGDAAINVADLTILVTSPDKINTYMGDANLDLEFDSGDLVTVFAAGEYQDAVEDNSGWAEGDWNGDGDFTSGDLVTAFSGGGYQLGPRNAVAAVPEPSSLCLLLTCIITSIAFRRKK